MSDMSLDPEGDTFVTRCKAVHQTMVQVDPDQLGALLTIELELGEVREIRIGGFYGVTLLVPKTDKKLVLPNLDVVQDLNDRQSRRPKA